MEDHLKETWGINLRVNSMDYMKNNIYTTLFAQQSYACNSRLASVCVSV